MSRMIFTSLLFTILLTASAMSPNAFGQEPAQTDASKSHSSVDSSQATDTPINMSTDSAQAAEVKAALVRLMHSAKNQEMDYLKEIYHEAMTIYMIDGNHKVMTMDKPKFIAHIEKVSATGAGQDTWADFHKVEANSRYGHILLSRKVELTGEKKLITLSIDFVYENGKWQIIRETIFTG